MSSRRSIFLVAMIALLPLWPLAADAHQRSGSGPHTGIAIAEISHGEMIMIAEYRDRIIDLAARATDTNEPFRRVLNYAQIQHAYCFWGKMPGSVTDEGSPFNECSHAYLAATKAVLLSMRGMGGEAAEAEAIVSAIDAGMVLRGLALITCQFSGEAFNTADIVHPAWRDVPLHPASMATLTALAAAILALVYCGRCLVRRITP
ncbi:hypothetical protein ATY81_24345 [Rhizobium sp. R72]|uniref:hypothetical protein n=1 Tax=unclassified Rhizobium TaxID=2613769 RepID=UPI000B535268|nr:MULTISPECIES: hypothetical protein [unclassified Rhizobium]OWV92538.1 hypothetical protein ATY79_28095 [Rhizobium sp. R693]OWW01495.1 hypothetical protein ATY81_24345 [Rhizobium sp. R72]OWW01583.1 hypothetical protein ATY80_24345 [Rhizobium sp. R711]